MKQLKEDIRQYGFPVLAVLIIWALANLFFEHFCPVVLMIGYPCPGCGLTRAFVSLVMLDIPSVIQYNPAAFLWAPLILAAIFKRYIGNGDLKPFLIPLIAVCIITIVIYIVRMIYVFPGLPPMAYEPDNLIANMLRH